MTLFTASATTRGGRNGHVESSDGALTLPLAMPRELGGPGGEGTNPEQLFAAGYAACFGSALETVARHQGVDVTGASVTASVRLKKDTDGFRLEVELAARTPSASDEQVSDLMERAHKICPYSRALHGNVDVRLVPG